MARLDSDLQFTGSMGNLTAYRMRGSDKIILRRKGGASPDQIKNSPAFQNVRRANLEFGGRATATKWIMKMMWPQKALADYNIAGPLNALLKPIQSLDGGEWGKRHVQLSKNPHLLAGFSLNQKNTFDSVIRASISFSMSRENRNARVDIPALTPRINFFPASQSFYSIQVVLGVVPDIFFNDGKYQPSSPLYTESNFATAETPWSLVTDNSQPSALEVSIPQATPDENFSIMLSIGIRYGAITNSGAVEQVKYVGAAKVLGLA